MVGQMTTPSADRPVAVVTGASSGIGAATARTLAAQGFHVVCAARREGPITALAGEIGGTAIVTDVTDDASVSALAERLDRVDLLVNNAGGARGLEPVADADLEHWRWMWESNVLGTLRVTRALLPKLIDSGDGLIVTVTSIAAVETYDNGAGYTSAKHAQGVLHRTLRSELLGKPVRLSEVAPGMVKTDFSLRRFDGDEERAAKVYEGVTPLVAEDIAEVIGFVASRPSHVDLDLIVIRPRDQVSGAIGSRFNRRAAR
jgi:NADP-dependent 3-hydroxy acid dehydrogenase YdfG